MSILFFIYLFIDHNIHTNDCSSRYCTAQGGHHQVNRRTYDHCPHQWVWHHEAPGSPLVLSSTHLFPKGTTALPSSPPFSFPWFGTSVKQPCRMSSFVCDFFIQHFFWGSPVLFQVLVGGLFLLARYISVCEYLAVHSFFNWFGI